MSAALTRDEQAEIIQAYVQSAIEAGRRGTEVSDLTAKGITWHIMSDIGII